MIVTVIDSKRVKATVCSFKEAADIIGVCTKTISRWSISRRSETYNNFTLYFDTDIVKQPVRNKCPLKPIMSRQKR